MVVKRVCSGSIVDGVRAGVWKARSAEGFALFQGAFSLETSAEWFGNFFNVATVEHVVSYQVNGPKERLTT